MNSNNSVSLEAKSKMYFFKDSLLYYPIWNLNTDYTKSFPTESQCQLRLATFVIAKPDVCWIQILPSLSRPTVNCTGGTVAIPWQQNAGRTLLIGQNYRTRAINAHRKMLRKSWRALRPLRRDKKPFCLCTTQLSQTLKRRFVEEKKVSF